MRPDTYSFSLYDALRHKRYRSIDVFRPNGRAEGQKAVLCKPAMSHSPGVTDKNVCRARYSQETQAKCTLIGFQGIQLSLHPPEKSAPPLARASPLSYFRAIGTRLPRWSMGPLKSDHSLLRSHSRNVTLPFHSCRCTETGSHPSILLRFD